MNYGICDKHMDFNLSEMGAEGDLFPACFTCSEGMGLLCIAGQQRDGLSQSMRQVGAMCMKSRCYCEFFHLGYFEQRASAD